MIQAVIFDMDGLLIDSEPLWHEAEQRSFSKVGVQLTDQQCLETQGLRVDKVVEHWFERYPWEGTTKEDVEGYIQEEIIRVIQERGIERPGVQQALTFVKDKNVKIGLASSSADAIIDVVLDKLQIRAYFEVICSAQNEAYGKPHPAVYITTANKLQVRPEHCLALEDSLTGILAAKAACMQCVAVPDESLVGDERLAIADRRIDSLELFDDECWKKIHA